jgi:hypothetical protein
MENATKQLKKNLLEKLRSPGRGLGVAPADKSAYRFGEKLLIAR